MYIIWMRETAHVRPAICMCERDIQTRVRLKTTRIAAWLKVASQRMEDLDKHIKRDTVCVWVKDTSRHCMCVSPRKKQARHCMCVSQRYVCQRCVRVNYVCASKMCVSQLCMCVKDVYVRCMPTSVGFLDSERHFDWHVKRDNACHIGVWHVTLVCDQLR